MMFFNSKKKIESLTETLDKSYKKISELQRRNILAAAILESMSEAVIAVYKDTRILSINSSAEKIFGISKKDARGRIFLEVIRNSELAGIIDDVFKEARHISAEISLIWPVEKILNVSATPIFAKKEEFKACVLVMYDITQIRKLEAMRRDFVANVSHELKTPLTSIKGFIETLLAGALSDKKNSTEFLKIVDSHVDRLDNLVNDLLSLSYLESKQIELKKEKIGLGALVNDVLAGFNAQLAKKSIEAKNELPQSLIVTADKDKLSHVLTNFIDNAIKFNRKNGNIRIYSEDADGDIKIITEDTGIGIPPKDIPRIFERFYRVDKARSREAGGTGLGLSIVKHIIKLHNGETGVESTEGLGSKFWFTLPK